MEYEAIVLAAGNASRSNLGFNKIFYEVDGVPMIMLSTRNFINDFECVKIHVVYKKEELPLLQNLYLGVHKINFVEGGAYRQQSVANALKEVKSDYVMIHDGARPYYSNKLLQSLKDKLASSDSVIPVVNLKDTIKEIKDDKVVRTLNRDSLRIVQTPQAFRSDVIKKAHELATNNNYPDDASLVEQILNLEVSVVNGENKNYKFTVKEDF